MTDAPTDYASLLTRLGDADDGSGVTPGVGWIAPADVRSIVTSLAAQYAVNAATPTVTAGANQPVTPAGASQSSIGFGATPAAGEFFKVAASAPSRIGSLSLSATFSTPSGAAGTISVKVAGTTVLSVPVGTTAGIYQGSAAAVFFGANQAVTVETNGLSGSPVLSAFRLAATGANYAPAA